METSGITPPEAFRGYPEAQQRRFLVFMLGEEGINLPNGQKVGEFLARANNIPHFAPTRIPSERKIRQLTDRTLDGLGLPRLPVRILSSPWSSWQSVLDTVDKAKEREWDLTWLSRLDREWLSAWNKVWSTFWDVSEDRSWDQTLDPRRDEYGSNLQVEDAIEFVGRLTLRIGYRMDRIPREFILHGNRKDDIICNIDRPIRNGAIWTMFEDRMSEHGYKQDNPSIPLLEIAETGSWIVGPVQNSGIREFVLFVPPIGQAQAA